MTNNEIKDFLDRKAEEFNRPDFIPEDPISIPHQFTRKQDIEISGLIAAVFSWGQRKTILNKSIEFLNLMDNTPHDFVLNHKESDLPPFTKFVHRTFQPTDALFFLDRLKSIYQEHESLEELFQGTSMAERLEHFNQRFLSTPHTPERTRKHIPNPARNSACKRINMFLRWMVRVDDKGVDFGIWKSISTSELICPLDVHSGNTARELGLLSRTQSDWKAAIELTDNLRELDLRDPVKYDFALFGIGVSGGL